MTDIEVDFINVKKNNTTFYGGNQAWWKNKEDNLAKFGCGVIAMCNLELSINYTMSKHNNKDKEITFKEYKTYFEERYKEVYFFSKKRPFNSLGLMPTTMKRGIRGFFYKMSNRSPIVKWAPTLSKKKILNFINKMLKNNIAIPAAYYVFNKKHKLVFYSYDEKEGLCICANCSSHYFNITGYKKIQIKNKKEDFFVVSSWGEKYYIRVDQWIKKLSCFTNVLYIET